MKKSFLAIVLSAAISASLFSGCSSDTQGEMRDMSTMEIVQEMELGINLGNTFESCGMTLSSAEQYETFWGSPVLTQEMIQGYADSGFSTLRIPVAWSNLMSGDYEISSDYLGRVNQVIDWALDADMYVIMNIHWDGGWFERFGIDDDRDECFYKYERIWTQLAKHFKNYGDKLIFESLNEEGIWNDIWNRYSNEGDKEKAYGLLNDINQKFVDLIRSSGGNNKQRHLLIAGYATDIDLTCDTAFQMPDDPAQHCAVSVHYYTPSTFAILEKDAEWGKARSEWGSEADYAELEKYMTMMKETFVDNGVPVIIGEYGTSTGNKTDEMISLYLSSVCQSAYTKGMCPVLWDITDVFYLRRSCEFKDPQLLQELMSVKEMNREV